MTKQDLRKTARERLAELSPSDWEERSLSLCSGLVEWLNGEPDYKALAVYAALPNEVNLEISHLLLPALEWHYPLVKGSALSFHRVSKKDSLVSGSFGIMEPNPMVHPPVREDVLQVILCPGLAFTSCGKRLGRGGGFYDRFLATVPQALKVGVCLEEQLESDLPVEEFDIPMTHLLTEQGLRKVEGNGGILA